MAARNAIVQSIGCLDLALTAFPAWTGLSLQAARLISTSARRLWPDVVVPSMGESIKEGSIAAVLKQVGQPVREDEVIAQVETDKVTIDVRAPAAGFVQKLLIKPADTVVAGQLVAVVGATAPAAGAPTPAAPAVAAPSAAAAAPDHGRTPMIHFPPRVTAAGERISGLPEAQYAAALAEAEAAARPLPPQPAKAPEAPPAAAPPAPAAPSYPIPAAKAAPPPVFKNRLQFVTRPDGRGGPPRRPLTERELEMINLGGVY